VHGYAEYLLMAASSPATPSVSIDEGVRNGISDSRATASSCALFFFSQHEIVSGKCEVMTADALPIRLSQTCSKTFETLSFKVESVNKGTFLPRKSGV
jgi:hypothetical protein